MFVQDLITEEQDLRYLKWTRIRKSSGTAGSYLKAYGTLEGSKVYYKLSCFDPLRGVTGHECVNELIVDRLLTVLGIDHLHYQLINARISIDGKEYKAWICASQDFKMKGDSKIAFDDYYDLRKDDEEDVWGFIKRMEWEDYFYNMLAVDYVILNRDRHGANVEIIKSAANVVKPAPLFDHGLSLIYSCGSDEEAAMADPLEDKPVQCYVGGRSARGNLDLIPSDRRPKLRKLTDREYAMVFEGLEGVLSKTYLDKIGEMIQERLASYENM